MKDLRNKVVMITGASSGIGEAVAIECAKQGAKVAVLARRLDRLKSVCERMRSLGADALALQCDVTQEKDLIRCRDQIIKEWGRLDVVIANAGYGVTGRVEQLKTQDYRNQFETNVFGLLNTIYATLDSLKESQGSLVLLGSIASYVSAPGASPYSMSKFAVRALAESLRIELKPFDVAVTLISPGYVASEIRKVDNLGKFHSEKSDPVPAWLMMPTEKAARQIVSAVIQKKREKVVTFHGVVLKTMTRLTPWIFDALFGLESVSGRLKMRSGVVKKTEVLK